MNLLAMVWGKTAATVVGLASLVIALLGIRFKIRKEAKDEMSNEIKERTIERIKVANDTETDVAGMSDDDILSKLREHGWLRD